MNTERPIEANAKPVRVRALKRKRESLRPPPVERHLHTPWIASLAKDAQYESVEQRLHDEIVAYSEYILPTSQERRARDYIFDTVKEVLKRRFPQGSVHLFGSCVFDLCLPNGDLDICVNTNASASKGGGGGLSPRSKETKRSLYSVSTMLKQAAITGRVNVIANARVPIVSFDTYPGYGGYSVDIGLDNIDGIKAIPIVQKHLAEKPALKPLVLVIKGFLAQRELGSAASSGLSSYAVINITTSFLQLNPRGRPTAWIEDPMKSKSLGILLLDFLSYYGGVGYTIGSKPATRVEPPPVDDSLEQEITPEGQPAVVDDFVQEEIVGGTEEVVQDIASKETVFVDEEAVVVHTVAETLTNISSRPTSPREIKFGPEQTFPYSNSYISVKHSTLLPKAGATWIKVYQDQPKRLAIECMVRADNDVGRSSGRIEVIKGEFRKAFSLLRAVRLPKPEDGPYKTELNLLSGIVRLDQETMDRRAAVKRFVDETDAHDGQSKRPEHVERNERKDRRPDASASRRPDNERRVDPKFQDHGEGKTEYPRRAKETQPLRFRDEREPSRSSGNAGLWEDWDRQVPTTYQRSSKSEREGPPKRRSRDQPDITNTRELYAQVVRPPQERARSPYEKEKAHGQPPPRDDDGQSGRSSGSKGRRNGRATKTYGTFVLSPASEFSSAPPAKRRKVSRERR